LARSESGVLIQAHTAAEERFRTDVTEDKVRIRDCRIPTAPPVADRTWIGTGALRAHAEHPAGIDAGNAAAASAHGDAVERGDSGRKVVDIRLDGYARLSSFDQGDVSARPSHVEGDDVSQAESRGDRAGSRYATRRTGQERPYGVAADEWSRQRSAVRLHDMKRAAEAALAKRGFEVGEVAVDDWLDIGAKRRCAGAFILPVLGCDLVRECKREFGELATGNIADHDLVAGIRIGVEQADGDGGGSSRLQRA